MQVKSIADWSILQYFRPSLSYHLPLRPLFCLFLSGRLRQVLLYFQTKCRKVNYRLIFMSVSDRATNGSGINGVYMGPKISF